MVRSLLYVLNTQNEHAPETAEITSFSGVDVGSSRLFGWWRNLRS